MSTRKELTQFSRLEYENLKEVLEAHVTPNEKTATLNLREQAMLELHRQLKQEDAQQRFLGGFSNVKTVRVFARGENTYDFEYTYVLDAHTLERRRLEEERAKKFAELKAKPPQPPKPPEKKPNKFQKRKEFLQSKAGARAAYDEALKQREQRDRKKMSPASK